MGDWWLIFTCDGRERELKAMTKFFYFWRKERKRDGGSWYFWQVSCAQDVYAMKPVYKHVNVLHHSVQLSLVESRVVHCWSEVNTCNYSIHHLTHIMVINYSKIILYEIFSLCNANAVIYNSWTFIRLATPLPYLCHDYSAKMYFCKAKLLPLNKCTFFYFFLYNFILHFCDFQQLS